MRRADRDVDAIVLRELRELRVQAVSARDHRGGHPVDAPDAGAAAQGFEDLVQRAGEVPERHLLAEHRAEAARVRQRADQGISRLAPRSALKLKPVPLNLLTRRMVDLGRRRAAAALLAD